MRNHGSPFLYRRNWKNIYHRSGECLLTGNIDFCFTAYFSLIHESRGIHFRFFSFSFFSFLGWCEIRRNDFPIITITAHWHDSSFPPTSLLLPIHATVPALLHRCPCPSASLSCPSASLSCPHASNYIFAACPGFSSVSLISQQVVGHTSVSTTQNVKSKNIHHSC